MKKGILVVLLAAIAFAAYWFLIRKTENGFSGEKQVAIAIKKHSDKFNTSVSTMMSAYFDMQNAFVLLIQLAPLSSPKAIGQFW